MILEGPMIFIAVILLTIFHPGWVFGAELWVAAGFSFGREKKESNRVKETELISVDNSGLEQRAVEEGV